VILEEVSANWFRWWVAVAGGVIVALGALASTVLVPHPYELVLLAVAPLFQGALVGYITKRTEAAGSFGATRAIVISSILLIVTLGILSGGSDLLMLFALALAPIWIVVACLGSVLGKLCSGVDHEG